MPTTAVCLLLLRLLKASIFLAPVVVVYGYPTGAGQCLVGQASVGPPHMPATSGDTTLLGNGIEVSVDGSVLDPSTPFTIQAGTDHTLTISPTDGTTPFRGYLFALSVPSDSSIDLSTSLSPQDTATGQIATVCSAPVVGVTHVNNNTKTMVNATFVLDQDAELVLDVTVVIVNKLPFGGVSQYGFARYHLVNSASTGGGDSGPAPSTPTAAAPTAPGPVPTTSNGGASPTPTTTAGAGSGSAGGPTSGSADPSLGRFIFSAFATGCGIAAAVLAIAMV